MGLLVLFSFTDHCDRKVTHNNFILRWYCCWNVEISLRYNLKSSLQTQFFSCTAVAREAWTSNKDGAHVTVVSVLWAAKCSTIFWDRGHNPSEIHRDMCGVYGEDCVDRSNVSKWCAFFKAAVPWRMSRTWKSCYCLYSLLNTRYTYPCEFHSGYAL